MLNCPLCTKTFKSRSGFNTHVSSHNNERPYMCPKCPMTCQSSWYLQQHIKFVHDGVKRNNFKCPSCSFASDKKSRMEQHLQTHSEELPSSFSKKFKCSLCSKTFNTRTNLNRHASLHNNERPHKCPHYCSATFSRSWDLKNHVEVVHEGIKRNNIKCLKCSYACGSKGGMATHALTHVVERPFSCTVPGCGFKTKTEKYLPVHRRKVHELQERQYKCQVVGCDFKAKCLQTLQIHAFKHSNVRPFSCTVPECNYTCKRKIDLNGHTKRVYCDSAEKPYKCSTCDYHTKYKSYLQLHEDGHLNFKRFPCQAPNCSFTTNIPRNLRLHFDSKHRTKNVACTAPGCTYRCGSVILLKKHAKTHVSPIRKCPSESCNYSTRLPKHMQRHIARWHKELKTSTQVQRVRPNLLTVKLLLCHYHDCKFQTEFPHIYDRHLKRHQDVEFQRICQFCYVRFRIKGDLERHFQSHTKEAPYRCTLCNYKTVIFTYLRIHFKRVHGIQVIRENITAGWKNNNCRVCGDKFRSRQELVLHSMSHLNAVVALKRLKLVVCEMNCKK